MRTISLYVCIAMLIMAGCTPDSPTAAPPGASTLTPSATSDVLGTALAAALDELAITDSSATAQQQETYPPPTPTPSAHQITPPATLPIDEQLTFELVTQRGGTLGGLAVLDNHTAVVGIGPRLAAIDITDPTVPQQISASEVLPGMVAALISREGTVYVAAGRSLVVVDASDPYALKVTSQIDLPGLASVLLLDGQTLYAGGTIFCAREDPSVCRGFVAAINLTEMRLDDQAELDFSPVSLAKVNSQLVINSWTNSIVLLETDSFENTQRLTLPGTDVWPNAMRGYGDYLATSTTDSILLFDMQDSLAPHLVWTSESIWSSDSITLHDGYFYGVGPVPAGGYIPAREAVPAPPEVAGLESLPTSSKLAIVDDMLLASEYFDLSIFRLSDIRTDEFDGRGLAPVGTFGVGPPPLDGILVHGNRLIANGASLYTALPGSIYAVSLPDITLTANYMVLPEAPPPNYGEGLWSPAITSMTFGGNWLLALTQWGTFRLLDPVTLQLVHQLSPDDLHLPKSIPYDLAAPQGTGTLVYVLGGVSEIKQLYAIDFTDPAHPVVVDQLGSINRKTHEGYESIPVQMAASDDLVVVGGIDYLLFISASDLTIAAERAIDRFPGDVVIDGDLVVVADEAGLKLFDASIPENPKLLSEVALPGVRSSVAFSDNRLYVITGTYREDQLLVIELADPSHPVVIGQRDLAGGGWDPSYVGKRIAVWGDYVIVNGTRSGLYVFRIVASNN